MLYPFELRARLRDSAEFNFSHSILIHDIVASEREACLFGQD